MGNKLTYKGFTTTINYSNEGNCLYGKIEEIPGLVTFESDSASNTKFEFMNAVNDYLRCKDDIEHQGRWVYTYSNPDGWWIIDDSYISEQEAIKAAKENGPENASFYVGRCSRMSIPEIDVDILLERIDEEFAEEADLYDGDGLFDAISQNSINELAKELNKVFTDWCLRHNIKSNSYRILDVKCIQSEGDVNES